MRCIFCKQCSDGSKSIEHIIPESLGNKTNTLAQGVVCDKCNNYFAREVEKPFLEHSAIELLRFEEGVESKKGKIPPTNGMILPDSPVEVRKTFKDGIAGEIRVPSQFFNKIANLETGQIIFRKFNDDIIMPNGSVLSRFIGKIAIEAFAQRLQDKMSLLDEFIDDAQLDSLRNHVRFGKEKVWNCNVRRIYKSTNYWKDGRNGDIYQITNEYDFLFTEKSEVYFVLALFGIEFAINIGGVSIDGYNEWLEEHGNISPLHYGKNKELHEIINDSQLS